MHDENAADRQSGYDDGHEDTLWGMIATFYSRPMRSIAILVWLYALVFMVIAVFCAVQFFKTDQVKDQIMYAAIFVSIVNWITLLKIFAWQTIHKNMIKRAIKRLETRLTEVCSA